MFIAVCLVAANMRMTIMGIGPLLDDIAADRGVRPATLGMLASLPLIAWGIVSPFAHGVSQRFGMTRTVSWSLVLLIAGTVWRSLPGSPIGLWAGTALTGVALAFANVLLPAVIKREFPTRLALVMGIYSALLGGTGSVASGLVVPIAHFDPGSGELGWRVALLATGVLIPPALVIWVWATRGTDARRGDAGPDHEATEPLGIGAPFEPAVPAVNAATRTGRNRGTRRGGGAGRNAGTGRRIWGDGLAWQVALYMAAQSVLFYMLVTWLSPLQISRGMSHVAAGLDVMLLQVAGVIGSMLSPLLFRGRIDRWAPMLIPFTVGATAMGIAFVPSLIFVWLPVCGIACGASLSASLMLMAARARTAEGATALSGMSQSVGYLVGALGPVGFGALYEITGGWTTPFLIFFVIAVGQAALGISVGRKRFVLEPRG